MAIYNFGSINADYFYAVPHLPGPGETVQATALTTGLGGKGANQSVAAARAGAEIHHIGAVGADGAWALARLAELGVGTEFVATVPGPTGHATIVVDAHGENQIVTLAGANARQSAEALGAALDRARPGDLFLMQNETADRGAAQAARARGLTVIYSAAPFSVAAVRAVIDHVDLLAMNGIEAEQLCAAFETDLTQLPVPGILVTLGAQGAVWHDLAAGVETCVAAVPVDAVDTTGAGDTYIGYLAAGLDRGMDRAEAMRLAAGAAALKVTRPGTADAIPDLAQVRAFLAAR